MQYNTNSKGLSAAEKKKLLLSLDEDKFVQKPYMKIDDKKQFDSK